MTTLTVVTLNTWKGDGAYRARLAAMRQGLRALAPDIVLLQEALRAPEIGADTAAELAAELGLAAVWQPARAKRRTIDGTAAESWSGLAVLSRLPVVGRHVVPLPDDPRDGERLGLLVEVDHDGRRLTIACLHLTHLADAAALRQAQWAAVLAALPERGAAVIGGDFNAGLEAFDLGDCHDLRALAGVAPQPSLADGSAACIDHLLLRQDQPVYRVVSAARVLDQPIDGVLPSDHFGLAGVLGYYNLGSTGQEETALKRPPRMR